jgi:small-conductance mechanosensitive channel
MRETGKVTTSLKGWGITAILGSVLGTVLILATLEIIHRNTIPAVVDQQKYVIGAEVAFLTIFLTEMIARFISRGVSALGNENARARLRNTTRIIGYFIAMIAVVSILASNPTLGISVGAVVGVIIAFATQSIIGNVIAAILILNIHLVRIGDEIVVSGLHGTVTDINLTHTVIKIADDAVFIPNSVMMSTPVQRKPRTK